MKHLQQKHILVLGLGASGLALARWCVRWGAQVTVADTRQQPPALPALQQELPQVQFVCAAMDSRLLDGTGLQAIFKSPGLSPASTAPLENSARAQGLPIGNELTVFAQALAELQTSQNYHPQVIAITGTNGKTTVTSLTAQLVLRAGKTVAMAGNIGPTLLDTLAQHLDTNTLPEVWVLELSSFQLDPANDFEPTVATVLNISEDHLDWHPDMNAYRSAKRRVYGQHAFMLINRNDPDAAAQIPPAVKGKPARTYLTFGSDEPSRPGDYGLQTVAGMTWLVRADEADETQRRRKEIDEPELFIQRLMPADALRIVGQHNATNALAALALASAAGCAVAPMLHGLRQYRGEPHRVESVAIIDDVEYIDDSKGTNVGATVAALTGLGAQRKLVLILGGEGKGQDFSVLAQPVARHARAVVLIGRDAAVIQQALQNTGVTLLHADTLPGAVTLARQQAQSGDAVLLSPACASFDMFSDYEQRAQVFCQAVREWAQEAGCLS